MTVVIVLELVVFVPVLNCLLFASETRWPKDFSVVSGRIRDGRTYKFANWKLLIASSAEELAMDTSIKIIFELLCVAKLKLN